MKWIVTIGSTLRAGHSASTSYTTWETDTPPMETLRQTEESMRKCFADMEVQVWLAFAMPVVDPAQYTLNVVAEISRDLAHAVADSDPTLAQRALTFARKLQDTVGKVKIEVAP